MREWSAFLAAALLINACAGKESAALGSASKLDKKIKCAEVGRKWFGRLEAEHHQADFVFPAFAYNADLETCVCAYTEISDRYRTSLVVDVLTENVLASARASREPIASDDLARVEASELAAFASKRKKLLGE